MMSRHLITADVVAPQGHVKKLQQIDRVNTMNYGPNLMTQHTEK